MTSKSVLNSQTPDTKTDKFTESYLSSFRNKLINGDFDIWQRATSQTTNGYASDDRWSNVNTGSTKTHNQQSFALGDTSVPGNPKYFSRTVVSSVAAVGNFVSKSQKIEGVRTLSGQTATLTFYAKADAVKNIAIELVQSFGTGGSPSSLNTAIGSQLVALTTTWAKYQAVITVPSVAGKTVGTNNDDNLLVNFWFDAGSTYATRSASLGQQSGTFDISHVSLVQGDATAEFDPFSPRHIQQELALCQRYYQKIQGAITNIYVPQSGFGWYQFFVFPVAMQSVPSISFQNAVYSNVSSIIVNGPTQYSLKSFAISSAAGSAYVTFDIALDAEL